MIMDTKQLHDVLIDNNIELDMDNVADAEQVWIKAIFENKEDFADTFADYFAEMAAEKIADTGFELAAGYEYIKKITTTSAGSHEGIAGSYIAGAALKFTHAATSIALNHATQITKLVEDNSDQWMADCIGYHFDMQEGQKEDAAEFRADR
jgi:hypothetical protein